MRLGVHKYHDAAGGTVLTANTFGGTGDKLSPSLAGRDFNRQMARLAREAADGSGRRVDFRNTVIIMTSNVGSRKAARRVPVIGYGAHETEQPESANSRNGYMDAIEERFAPEFINRIDDIVLFNKLGFEQVKGIVRLELSGRISRAAEQGYTITVTDAACEKLADLGYDPRYGVRSLKRVVLEEIEEPLAHLIVSEDLLPEDSVLIDDSEEGITITRLAEKCTASA